MDTLKIKSTILNSFRTFAGGAEVHIHENTDPENISKIVADVKKVIPKLPYSVYATVWSNDRIALTQIVDPEDSAEFNLYTAPGVTDKEVIKFTVDEWLNHEAIISGNY